MFSWGLNWIEWFRLILLCLFKQRHILIRINYHGIFISLFLFLSLFLGILSTFSPIIDWRNRVIEYNLKNMNCILSLSINRYLDMWMTFHNGSINWTRDMNKQTEQRELRIHWIDYTTSIILECIWTDKPKYRITDIGMKWWTFECFTQRAVSSLLNVCLYNWWTDKFDDKE